MSRQGGFRRAGMPALQINAPRRRRKRRSARGKDRTNRKRTRQPCAWFGNCDNGKIIQLNRAAPIVESVEQLEIRWTNRRCLGRDIVKLLSRVYPKVPLVV